MIPLRDTLQLRRTPVVNRAILIAIAVSFVAQFLFGDGATRLINIFGFIPARFFDPSRFHYTAYETIFTLISSLFLHGGMVHVAGNMIYLWIFGDDVEDRLGRLEYLVFFLACGAVGSLTHALLYPQSSVPSIGASGSIAGILGAFLVLHPKARIVTLIPLVVSWALVEIPVLVFLPVWFGLQFMNGFLALASARGVQEVAGVAWWAHIGGFAFGVVVGLWF
ncbi:MAG TPA: rhomboid family intramembrane serine protease, partial [Thermoanaerobaculia bacterium]